ncbi:MAG: hypothetical protein K6G69_04810 [Lachnospiraceae bacterium]|nr:hypothetical protein [Lachnospiraceae bacterium]
MDSSVKKILVIMLMIVAVTVIGVGVIFAVSQNKVRDWDALKSKYEEPTPEPKPTGDAQNPYDLEKEQKGDTSKKVDMSEIRVIVLRNKSENPYESYRFELQNNGGELSFTAWYPTEDGDIVCNDEKLNSSRINDISDILERYTVASVIQSYRADPKSVSVLGDDTQTMEISFVDGDYINLGFPNGAGKALEKYFKELTIWLNATNR